MSHFATRLPIVLIVSAQRFPVSWAAAFLVSSITLLFGCGGGGSGSSTTVNNQSCGVDSYQPNYVAEMTANSGQLLQWSAFPISVAYYNSDSWTFQMKAAAAAALNAWTSASGGRITFTSSNDTSTADLTMKWELSETLGGNTVGLTTLTFSSSTIRDTDIRLAAYDAPFVQRSLNDLTEIATHEVGHALGIGGHSPVRSDLMYAYINPSSPVAPNSRDWNTLRTAYCDDFKSRSRAAITGPTQTITIACPNHE